MWIRLGAGRGADIHMKGLVLWTRVAPGEDEGLNIKSVEHFKDTNGFSHLASEASWGVTCTAWDTAILAMFGNRTFGLRRCRNWMMP